MPQVLNSPINDDDCEIKDILILVTSSEDVIRRAILPKGIIMRNIDCNGSATKNENVCPHGRFIRRNSKTKT